jgi:hypothetical protein
LISVASSFLKNFIHKIISIQVRRWNGTKYFSSVFFLLAEDRKFLKANIIDWTWQSKNILYIVHKYMQNDFNSTYNSNLIKKEKKTKLLLIDLTI